MMSILARYLVRHGHKRRSLSTYSHMKFMNNKVLDRSMHVLSYRSMYGKS